ncbi:MAG: GTP 3',8-cyclase MoaA [Proteobacteria bacterium]|nr:GTP 3',8-cyclase MoaA [Pseudomonadota bacterium]
MRGFDTFPVSFRHEAAAVQGASALCDTLNRPLQDLRISVTDRCNLRCSYCMPSDSGPFDFVPTDEHLNFEETDRLVRVFTRLGVRKIRITGGEPLLRPRLPALIRRLRRIPVLGEIALTTNGVLLARNAAALADAGLSRVTVSLDSLDEQVLGSMNGGRALVESVLASIDAASEAGLSPVKINVVVQRGVNDHTVLDLLERFRHSGHVVRMIEYMDTGTRNCWQADDVVPTRELIEWINERWPIKPVPAHYLGEVARRYVYTDGAGEIGFISSISQPFCGSCQRVRLSTDGVLYTCLFATQGTDLRGPLRAGASDNELEKIIAEVWQTRGDRYSEIRASGITRRGKVEMYRVGG